MWVLFQLVVTFTWCFPRPPRCYICYVDFVTDTSPFGLPWRSIRTRLFSSWKQRWKINVNVFSDGRVSIYINEAYVVWCRSSTDLHSYKETYDLARASFTLVGYLLIARTEEFYDISQWLNTISHQSGHQKPHVCYGTKNSENCKMSKTLLMLCIMNNESFRSWNHPACVILCHEKLIFESSTIVSMVGICIRIVLTVSVDRLVKRTKEAHVHEYNYTQKHSADPLLT